MGGPNIDHAFLVRLYLVPRDNVVGKKENTEKVPALRMASVKNAVTGEAILEVMRDIKFTAWRFSLQSAARMVLQRRPQEKSLTLGQRILSAIKEDCPHLKFV